MPIIWTSTLRYRVTFHDGHVHESDDKHVCLNYAAEYGGFVEFEDPDTHEWVPTGIYFHSARPEYR